MNWISKVSESVGEIQSSNTLNILITGAAGNIGYSLSFMIAQGYMLG